MGIQTKPKLVFNLIKKNQETSLVEHTRIELVCFSPCKGDDHSMQSRAP